MAGGQGGAGLQGVRVIGAQHSQPVGERFLPRRYRTSPITSQGLPTDEITTGDKGVRMVRAELVLGGDTEWLPVDARSHGVLDVDKAAPASSSTD